MAAFEIKMPKLGESITEGTIMSWSVKAGDNVEEDDILFEVNTAKVSAEIPSPVAGKVQEILFNEGDTVSVGTVVAIIDTEAEAGGLENSAPVQAEAKPAAEEKAPQAPRTTQASETAQVPATEELTKGGEERWYSPVVLDKAREANIGEDELDAIPGTGYLGRLTKRDMERYIDGGKKAASKPLSAASAEAEAVQHKPAQPPVPVYAKQEDKVIPMDFVRRIISDRMTESKRISPHVTNVIEVDVTKLVHWREQNKEDFRKKEGINLTYMPAITEAAVMALKEFPRVNSSVDGYNIIEKKGVNMGIAVSLDDGNLIVPVIKDADKLNFSGLAAAISTLASKARSNKLMPADIEGGTFTITNFGSFKSLFGTPIINQPEIAILGVGVVEKRPAVIETPDGDSIAIRSKMYLSLSYDHRVIDGALGGNFLYYIARYLENWNG